MPLPHAPHLPGAPEQGSIRRRLTYILFFLTAAGLAGLGLRRDVSYATKQALCEQETTLELADLARQQTRGCLAWPRVANSIMSICMTREEDNQPQTCTALLDPPASEGDACSIPPVMRYACGRASQ